VGFFTPPRVAFGAGALEGLASVPGDRAFMLVDPGATDPRSVSAAREQREKLGRAVEVWEVRSLDLEEVPRALARARESGPDVIVGLGGEELLDLTKMVSALYGSSEVDPSQVTPLVDLPTGSDRLLVLVPDSVGPGNEMSWTAMLRPDREGPVRELTHRSLAADRVILDPLLTRAASPAAVALGAADALSHALESLGSEWSDPFSQALAKQAVEILVARAPRVLRPEPPEDLREHLLVASGLAGLAQAHTQMGMGHALAYALAPRFGVSHGKVAATLLPSVLEFTFLAARERYRPVGHWLGEGPVRSGSELANRVRELWEALGVPRDLSQAVPVPRSELEAALPSVVQQAEHFTGMVATGRVPSSSELSRLLLCAWEGRPVDF
jgi:alcohol dehydrogenase class IV